MRRRRRSGRLSMTSLIDVIFLLLLFFMLTSTFSKFSEVELAAEGTSDEAVLANTQRFTIIIEGAVRARPEQWTWIHRRWKSADRTPLD